ncbi:MAG: DUF5615 family PIN-like protein [Planctomycetes bacterium]|nr:DUF5615 family PIN-like protein [Planctomycetota bacterium]
MIRFLLDMGLPRRACEDLAAAGIDVVHLAALGFGRLPDPEVIALAVREERTIVTLDRDFSQLLAVSRARAPSVVYIRQNVDRSKTVSLVLEVLTTCEGALAAGSIVSVTEEQIRVRSLPIGGGRE